MTNLVDGGRDENEEAEGEERDAPAPGYRLQLTRRTKEAAEAEVDSLRSELYQFPQLASLRLYFFRTGWTARALTTETLRVLVIGGLFGCFWFGLAGCF